jgi:tetratricopeptide (TPR) repeat protein
MLSLKKENVRGLIVIGLCISVQGFCVAQVTNKSQAMGNVGKANADILNSPKTTATTSVPKSTDTVIKEEVEKVVVVSKIAPKGVDINYIPLFGKYEKTEEQQITDEMFKSDCDKEFSSRKAAGDFFNKMAWQYLSEGDKATAINRFNLSYLLNPDNFDVYWGLGVIEFQDGNFSNAIELMNKGVSLSDGKNYVFMTDLATIYIKEAMSKPNAVIECEKAKELLNGAVKIQPQYTPAFVQLTIVNLLENHLDAAWENFHKAYDLNPAELSKEVLIELLSRKDDPKGIFKKN